MRLASAPGFTTRYRYTSRRPTAFALRVVPVVLVVPFPACLVLAPLGGAGGPATVFAAVLFVFYLVTWLRPVPGPVPGPARSPQPVRLAVILFACVILASYVSANRHTLPTLEKNGADRGLISLAGWLGVLLIAADGIDSMDRLRTLVRRVVFGATAMAVLCMTQFFTGLDATKYIKIPGLVALAPFTDVLSRADFNRPAATATHPIEL